MNVLTKSAAGAIALAAITSVALHAAPAPQDQFGFRYAVKVVCAPEAAGKINLAAQTYMTSINIHNPAPQIAHLNKRLVLTTPKGGETPQGPLDNVYHDTLPPNYAMSTDCADLKKFRAPIPFEGFVLIESTVSLDIVGVYTTPGGIDIAEPRERKQQ